MGHGTILLIGFSSSLVLTTSNRHIDNHQQSWANIFAQTTLASLALLEFLVIITPANEGKTISLKLEIRIMFLKLFSRKFKTSSSSFNCPRVLCLLLISPFIIPELGQAQSDGVYYPGPTGEWESRRAEDMGVNPDALQKAVDLAMAN